MAVAQIIIVMALIAVEILLLRAVYDIGKCDGIIEALNETEEDMKRLIRNKYA